MEEWFKYNNQVERSNKNSGLGQLWAYVYIVVAVRLGFISSGP